MRGGFFYNTNGFAFHRLEDATSILAELGYDGIALTPDVHHLDPYHASTDDIRAFREDLARHDLGVIIETGARFVLDARRKHRPSLLDAPEEATRRLDFLKRCVDLATQIGAPLVTVWSGGLPAAQSQDEAMARLTAGLNALCTYAAEHDVRIGFEPEPGMFIERADAWPALKAAVDHPALGLTLDVGHCLATNEGDPADVIREHAHDLVALQLDDHRPGVHEHLAFGDGAIDFERVGAAIRDVRFTGPLEVELSRHAATAPATARESLEFLRRALG